MTTTTTRALGQAPELTYEPSACSQALLECDWPAVLADIDPRGCVQPATLGLLARRPWTYRYQGRRIGPRGQIAHLPTETGRRLRRLRFAANLTSAELSARSGVRMDAIYKYETGDITLERAAYSTVFAIAAALDVAPDDLFGDVPPARVA